MSVAEGLDQDLLDASCIFCRILKGEIPSDKVGESEFAYAFRDLSPKAPLHVLVIPKRHAATVGELAQIDPALVGELALLAQQVAKEQGSPDYRLIFNNGETAGQSVFHTHGHVIGGQQLGWNPA